MKTIVTVFALILSLGAFASEVEVESDANCTIRTTARVKEWPLAAGLQKIETTTADLAECKELAHSKLCSEYSDILTLPGGIDSSGGSANVTFKIYKAKYKYKEGNTVTSGKYKYKIFRSFFCDRN